MKDDKVTFHYIKSNFFRVVHVDGAIGGLTPTGDLFLSLYSQRGPIPVSTVQEITDAGTLGKELEDARVTKEGLVREVEIGVAIKPEIATQLVKFLQDKIELANRLRKEEKKATTK